MITAIIVAGGKGTRMGAGINKVFISILGKEILAYTIEAFECSNDIDEIVVVTAKDDMELCKHIIDKYKFKKVRNITEGGDTRQQSVEAGLKAAKGDIVLIHDGARSLIQNDEIRKVLCDCKKYGAAAVGVVCKDTLKLCDSDGFISGTIDRSSVYQIQTPQAFYRSEILSFHEKAAEEGFCATDDCMIAEHYGRKIKITQGRYDNIKLTTPDDLETAKQILMKQRNNG